MKWKLHKNVSLLFPIPSHFMAALVRESENFQHFHFSFQSWLSFPSGFSLCCLLNWLCRMCRLLMSSKKNAKLCLVVAAVVRWKHSHTPKSEGITPSKATHSYCRRVRLRFSKLQRSVRERERRKAHEANAHKQSGPQQIERVDFFLAFISEAYEYEQF